MNPNVSIFATEVDPEEFLGIGRDITLGTAEGALRPLYVSKNSGRLLTQTDIRYAKDVLTVTDAVSLTLGGTYASGDSVGGLLHIDWGYKGNGLVESVTIIDGDKQNCALDLVLFFEAPVDSTITDNSPMVLGEYDRIHILGVIRVAATDYVDLGAYSVATKLAIMPSVLTTVTGRLSLAIVARGTPTYTFADGAKSLMARAIIRAS